MKYLIFPNFWTPTKYYENLIYIHAPDRDDFIFGFYPKIDDLDAETFSEMSPINKNHYNNFNKLFKEVKNKSIEKILKETGKEICEIYFFGFSLGEADKLIIYNLINSIESSITFNFFNCICNKCPGKKDCVIPIENLNTILKKPFFDNLRKRKGFKHNITTSLDS